MQEDTRGNLSARAATGAIFTAEQITGRGEKKGKHGIFRIMANEPIENLMD